MFVLKHNDSFAILDKSGSMWERNEKQHDIADGLVCRDTRILSRLELAINGAAPDVVNTKLGEGNVLFTTQLKHGGLDITRAIFLFNDSLYEQLTVKNATDAPVTAQIAYSFGADFLDLFEIRGAVRPARGTTHAVGTTARTITFRYTGLDKVEYRSTIVFSADVTAAGATASLALQVPANGAQVIYLKMGADTAGTLDAAGYDAALAKARAFIAAQVSRRPSISSSNPVFDQWVRQNAVDIALLTTQMETGPYVCAGIPWYSVPFGRDAIITAWQLLWQDPDLAKGVLTLLAKFQATEESAFHDSAPGKILHEIRSGEMARLHEIPHTPYYGTADATPLFVSLAGAWFARTGDRVFAAQLWPHIERALGWINIYGDKDGDGFVEYQRGAESGLGNQGWKDSQDSISHADGALALGAIALCEVQGYVYDAKKSAAAIALALGHADAAKRLTAEADALKEKFNAAYWSDELGSYALALDGAKKPCLVSSSNPGHLLFSGIATPERAKKTAEKLMSPDMFSGWGIRTLGSREKRYEPSRPPEGYHNGTVWVHDTALCAAGMARYGMQDKAAAVMTALFEAAQNFLQPPLRLPELFGGLPREDGKPPAPYPVACSPQAWASASESLLLQSMLGMTVAADSVTVQNPQLPAWLEELTIRGLKTPNGSASLVFKRQGARTTAEMLETTGAATVTVA
ncbi:MAG: amylo-alpha-1,6-glucosidase [Micavibrio sp.]|nr:amylo-alpha-1,6-glucosidase [Micavibrio sp.]